MILAFGRGRDDWCGALAQLVEHLLCKQGVNGSNPLGSTNISGMKIYGIRPLAGSAAVLSCGFAIIDIVNGFENRCRSGCVHPVSAVWVVPLVSGWERSISDQAEIK